MGIRLNQNIPYSFYFRMVYKSMKGNICYELLMIHYYRNYGMRSGVVLSSQQKRDKHVHCFMFDDMLILKLKLVGLRDMLMHTRKSGEVK
jgi:hypothetical protein